MANIARIICLNTQEIHVGALFLLGFLYSWHFPRSTQTGFRKMFLEQTRKYFYTRRDQETTSWQ